MKGADMAGRTKGSKPKNLSAVELARLERFERTQKNRRGRTSPSVVPAKLARTSAFVARRFGLSTDANFQRVYAVAGYSVIEVRGRELGSQHRDALYALFRVRAKRIEEPNPEYNPNITTPGLTAPRPTIAFMETRCTWRDLLLATGRTAHVNNLGTLLRVFQELQQVIISVYSGSYEDYLRATKSGRIAGAGFSENILSRIDWDGVNLDSTVIIRYGEWVRKTFEMKHLVSLNADVYFKLKSDYAKSVWPYLDSQPSHTWIDDAKLAELVGRDIANETSAQRRKFHEDCRQSFDDMTRAGGIAEWKVEQIGSGRIKTHRYTYVHALPRQGELPLMISEADLTY
jgi:hypothetical protein